MIGLLNLTLRKAIKQHVAIIEAYYIFQLGTKYFFTFCCQCYLQMQRNFWGIISVDLDPTFQPRVIYSTFVKYLTKMVVQLIIASTIYRLKESL